MITACNTPFPSMDQYAMKIWKHCVQLTAQQILLLLVSRTLLGNIQCDSSLEKIISKKCDYHVRVLTLTIAAKHKPMN